MALLETQETLRSDRNGLVLLVSFSEAVFSPPCSLSLPFCSFPAYFVYSFREVFPSGKHSFRDNDKTLTLCLSLSVSRKFTTESLKIYSLGHSLPGMQPTTLFNVSSEAASGEEFSKTIFPAIGCTGVQRGFTSWVG